LFEIWLRILCSYDSKVWGSSSFLIKFGLNNCSHPACGHWILVTLKPFMRVSRYWITHVEQKLWANEQVVIVSRSEYSVKQIKHSFKEDDGWIETLTKSSWEGKGLFWWVEEFRFVIGFFKALEIVINYIIKFQTGRVIK